MGRYIRQTTKGNWKPDQLKNAIEAVKKGQKIRVCAKKYKIPESTLRRRMKGNNLNSPILGVSTTFTPEQERVIAEYLKNVSGWYHGLNSVQCRRIAFDTAEKLKVKHKFSKKRKIAGKDWFYGFLKRNPDFSIRKPEVQDDRLRQFYKKELDKLFNDLNDIVEKYEFTSNRIYNVQETEIYAVKVKESTDCDQSFNSEVSWQRSMRTAVTCAMSAVGSFLPPMFIFPFEDKMQLMKVSTPENSVVECNAEGRVDEEMHLIWLKHFAEMVNPTRNDPVLLILNSHNGHASIDAYEFCKANNIHVLTLPPHVAYQMQPLTATIFTPVKRAYYRECQAYMASSQSNEISVYKIADLFARAFDKTATIDKAIKGFKLTGIWPVDPSMLDGKKFNCSNNISSSRDKDSSNSNDSAEYSSTSSSSSDMSSTSTSSSEDSSESSDAAENSEEHSDWYEDCYKRKTLCKKKSKCH